ncbi:MAG: lysylphosphatidylglycerol synthase transmembrane domain-containing protein [Bryobacteraceae bacterium]
MKSDGKGRLWSWILAVPLAAVLLYYSLRGVDWSGVWRTIAGARWGLVVVASAFSCCSFFLRAVRWRILLNAEARLSLGQVFCANMSGYLGNAFLPARAGELVRTLIVSSRSSLSKTYVLTTALSERLMDVIALVLWSSIILLGVHPKPHWMTDVSRATAAVATLGALSIAVLPHTGSLCRGIIQRVPLPHKLRDGLLHLVDQVLLGMRAFHSVRRFLGFAALTVTIWLSDAVTMMICGRGLGLELSFPVTMLLITALGLASALPSTPGYVGIYQFVAVTVLVPFGFRKDAALAYILVAQALGYVMVLLLGLPCVYVLKRRRQP